MARITHLFPGLGTSGTAAVEFALVAPLLIMMLFGVTEETAVLRAQMKVSHAAGVLATMIAAQTSTVTPGTAGTLGNLCYGAKLTLTPLGTAPFAAAIASVTTSASGSSTSTAMDWESDTSCPTAAKAIGATAAVGIATSARLVPNAGDSMIIVQASYTYTATTHFVLAPSYTLTQSAYARPRTNNTIGCTGC
jgi:Flp pilus assembly protein TadG